MDQFHPQNYLVLVDNTVGASAAFNAACHLVKAMRNKDSLFLLNLCSLRTGLFVSNDKKEAHAKKKRN